MTARDRQLLIPAIITVLATGGVAVLAYGFPAGGPGGVAFSIYAWLLLPTILGLALAWTVVSVIRRRPLRHDLLGWICWTLCLALSLAVVGYGSSEATSAYSQAAIDGGGVGEWLPAVLIMVAGLVALGTLGVSVLPRSSKATLTRMR